jgi:hypothetical protein
MALAGHWHEPMLIVAEDIEYTENGKPFCMLRDFSHIFSAKQCSRLLNLVDTQGA